VYEFPTIIFLFHYLEKKKLKIYLLFCINIDLCHLDGQQFRSSSHGKF